MIRAVSVASLRKCVLASFMAVYKHPYGNGNRNGMVGVLSGKALLGDVRTMTLKITFFVEDIELINNRKGAFHIFNNCRF